MGLDRRGLYDIYKYRCWYTFVVVVVWYHIVYLVHLLLLPLPPPLNTPLNPPPPPPINPPLLFTNLKNQQNLLHLTKELSLHDIPLLFVLAPLGVVLGLIGSVPFGWVLWNLGAVHPVLGFGIGVVWVWSWGVLRGLLTVISAWVVGRWYNNNNNTKLLLPCLHASLPTITLSSLILSAIHILTFLINLLSLFSSFSSWFSLWSWFWFWFSPWSRFRSWTHLLVWCLHRITARFNPYTLVYIGFTGAHPNHSLSIPNRPINKVSSPLPLPLAFILAFALITYSSPYPSPQPTLSSFPLLLNLTLTSTLVSAFCTSLVNDIGDALWVSWLLDGEGHPGREEKRKRVREVFDYSSPDSRHSPNSRHSLPSPNSLDSPNSPNYANSEDPESISIPISVIVHGRQTQTPTQTPTQTQTRGSSRNINTMDMDPMDFTDTMMDDTDTDVTDTDMDETDLDPFVPGV
ncbi:hypothetical protein DFJ43DRAFT_167212 [Lentinula guzmanii]|uniref:Protein PNS1 n=1 Tax=Lentinula guzmanii TaxID=2804957 RepID=A0AA38JVY3_9AGAR|nr:hypothetical protein DFJ43DRAFT_167212 [Lentinula guzmanii]